MPTIAWIGIIVAALFLGGFFVWKGWTGLFKDLVKWAFGNKRAR